MELQLTGKTALVTGASGGIGRAIAEAFAAEGANVVCHARTQLDALDGWLATRPWADRALSVQADIRRPAELDAMFRAARERFGRVDACVANAGARPPAAADLVAADPERIRTCVENNLMGAVWTARAFLKSLQATGPAVDGASLLFIGSTAATFGERGYADYAAAKAGLIGLTRTLKNEIVALDPRGRVNLLEPGWTATHVARPALENLDLVRRVVQTMPLKQIARAEDIANTAVWISAPIARHLTGQTVTVAGGMEGRVLWDPDEIDPEAVRREARE